jgi:hypothetical protein
MEQTTPSSSVAYDEDSCDRLVDLIIEQQEAEAQLINLENQIQEIENSLQEKSNL